MSTPRTDAANDRGDNLVYVEDMRKVEIELQQCQAENEMLINLGKETEAKLQYLVNNWPKKLEDGKIYFPDGDYREQEIK